MLTYAQALRAIGQDLQNHGALAYEINVNLAEYVFNVIATYRRRTISCLFVIRGKFSSK